MARLPDRFESATAPLIKHLTGFVEGERNYEICMQYALSNFNFHRFLDVNSHQVQRAIDGVCEKFIVHSQEEKADTLRRLCDKFLQSEVFRDHPTIEVQYAVISLLLNLSNRPTETSHDRSIEAVVADQDADGFDWGRYLLDGEENAAPPSEESSDLSEWSDEEMDEQSVVGQVKSNEDNNDVKGQASIKKPPIPSKPVTMTASLGETWRLKNVMEPYWLRATTPHSFESSFPAKVVHKCSPLSCSNVEAPYVLTERQVIREVLWLLQGMDTFLFQRDGPRCSLRENVTLKCVTQQSFAKMLSPVVGYGSIVWDLKGFVEETIGAKCLLRPNAVVPRTYEAYASSLSDVLGEMAGEIDHIDRVVFDQKETFTLFMALDRVAPLTRKLAILDRIHKEGVETMKRSNACEKASNLLNVLYEYLLELHLSTNEPEDLALVANIFLKTVRPYVDIIEGWLLTGLLRDHCDELVIQRKDDIKLLDEKFWDLAVIVRPGAEITLHFFKPILDILVVAGKSMEISSRLGKLHAVTKNADEYNTRSLYQQFLDDIFLKCNFCDPDADEKAEEDGLWSVEGPFVTKLDVPIKSSADDVRRVTDALKQNNFSSLHETLQLCLLPRIEALRKHVCENLIEVLKGECSMNEYLHNIRKYLLMGAGDVMHTFLSQLFQMSPETDIRNEELSINMLLEDTFSSHSELMPRMQVVIADTGSKAEPIHRLDPVTLSYELPWPLDIIVNEECRLWYKQIFTFLVQIKRAKHALDELRFKDLAVCYRNSKTSILKRMHILRMHLLNVVNCFHGYVLNTVIGCSWLQFKKSMDSAKDLQDIIDSHAEFVQNVHERCFLSTGGSVIHDPVMIILNQSLLFENIWNNTVNEKSIGDVEKQLNYVRKFLSMVITTAMQKGHRPHMEALFVAFVGSLPRQV